MKRTLYSEEHGIFQNAVRQFIEREVKPHQERWMEQRMVDREVWKKAGEAGLLCTWVPEQYGGAGGDFLYAAIITEEFARAYESGFAIGLHSDVVVPYLYGAGTDAQKDRWIPGCVRGDIVTAIAMTEPGTGSDLAGMRTAAVKDGDDYIINGSKTFISNGQICDLVVVAAKKCAAVVRVGGGVG